MCHVKLWPGRERGGPNDLQEEQQLQVDGFRMFLGFVFGPKTGDTLVSLTLWLITDIFIQEKISKEMDAGVFLEFSGFMLRFLDHFDGPELF